MTTSAFFGSRTLSGGTEPGTSISITSMKAGSVRLCGERGSDQGENAARELAEKVKQAYRIVLTRGLKGLFIWVKDDETRLHLRTSLGEA